MRRTRIVLGLASIWGTDIAGMWRLEDRHVIVLTGVAVAVSLVLMGRWRERRAIERTQVALTAANEREQALIKTIGRLTGVPQTGPAATLRDAA